MHTLQCTRKRQRIGQYPTGSFAQMRIVENYTAPIIPQQRIQAPEEKAQQNDCRLQKQAKSVRICRCGAVIRRLYLKLSDFNRQIVDALFIFSRQRVYFLNDFY